MKIKCKSCDGCYKVRESQYGLFGGCSKFPNCKFTIKLSDLVFEFFSNRGIDIYCWERECYKCKKKTLVYSYFLYYSLEELDSIFTVMHGLALGDISWLDNFLSHDIETIKKCFSKTTNSSYIANICIHCGALQGRNYVVDDPHEIMQDLFHDHCMEKYLYKTISVTNNDLELLADLRNAL
jgi:ssDNA-binding Zn-finger/Zn-ribbon topoisomerase 1